MMMLNQLQPKEIANIRQDFASCVLYNAIKAACCDCCALTQTTCLRQEHIFIEIISYLDELKEQQQDIDWHNLYKDIYQDYRYQNSLIPDEELHVIASTIICTLASILTISIPSFYHSLAKNLFQQVFVHNQKIPRERLFALMDTIEQYDKELSQWLANYMKSDEFISDNIKKYMLSPETLIKWTPPHIITTKKTQKEFNITSQPIQPKLRKGKKVAEIKPYTIKYICRNQEEQNQRLQILLRKWVEWEWIEDVKNADYFFDFFSGDILNCNLKWIGKNKATLYELLKTILEQPYIQKKENCTARSIAVGQFKEPNIRANKSRVNNTDQWRIIVSSLLLNPSKQLPKPKREAEKELDFSDNALNILFSNDLHVTRNL